MDHIFDLPYARSPHPSYADAQRSARRRDQNPAWEVIRFSINIMRGCFGGCTFCSITEHEGRIIQSRPKTRSFARSRTCATRCRASPAPSPTWAAPRPTCTAWAAARPRSRPPAASPAACTPGICQNLTTNHDPLIQIYKPRGRAIKASRRILIGSGLRYDLAIQSPEYVKELVQHHVGGYLKIAPEHTESGPLTKMMKPGIGNYDKFKQLFEKYTQEAGKKQFLIPYFIAAHPGTSDGT